MDDLIWYAIGRKKERRIHERALAVERYTMEQGLRAQYGLPPLPTRAHPRFVPAGRPLITARRVRRLALLLVVLLVAVVLLLAIALIGYGIQHHLIYMAPSR